MNTDNGNGVRAGWAYMLNGEKVWVQKFMGEYHYWTVVDGWHPLSEIARMQLKQCEESGIASIED